MNVDLNNTSEYDKTVIYLDSRNSKRNDDTNFDFYINFNEPLKNVFAIKLENLNVVSNVLVSIQDMYFVQINDYERSTSYINYEDDFNIVKYFEAVPYKGTLNTGGVYFVNIRNGGTGYTKNTVVNFGDPQSAGGVKARGTVKLDASGKVTQIIMTNIGRGYTSAPVISLNEPSGSGADFEGTTVINNYTSSTSHLLSATNFSDPTLYVLNPPEPNLTRFQISVRDKNFKKIGKDDINYINLSICVYSIKKNVLYKQ
jgi:hypothetical protein